MSIHAGLRVRHWRELKGISQLELSKRAKIDKTRLNRIEKGKLSARSEELERIAAELALTMPEFYGAIGAAKSDAAEAKSS